MPSASQPNRQHKSDSRANLSRRPRSLPSWLLLAALRALNGLLLCLLLGLDNPMLWYWGVRGVIPLELSCLQG